MRVKIPYAILVMIIFSHFSIVNNLWLWSSLIYILDLKLQISCYIPSGWFLDYSWPTFVDGDSLDFKMFVIILTTKEFGCSILAPKDLLWPVTKATIFWQKQLLIWKQWYVWINFKQFLFCYKYRCINWKINKSAK